MIDDGFPTLKWPVILLQIDVNAIPIRSVVDEWSKTRDRNPGVLATQRKQSLGMESMPNPTNLGSVQVDRKRLSDKTLLTQTSTLSG
jgi:hypothetical protein